MGEYQPGVDYVFDHNVAIIDGNLRIYCATKGVLGQVPWTPLNPAPLKTQHMALKSHIHFEVHFWSLLS